MDFSSIQEFFSEVDTTGIQDLILALFTWARDFNVRDINTDYLAELLTTFAPIWNPIWEYVNSVLNEYFGF